MSKFKLKKKILPLLLIITSLLAIAKLLSALWSAPAAVSPFPEITRRESLGLNSQIKVPILLYHHISPSASGDYNSVSPENFQSQMAWLKDNGYRVIAYSQFFDALTSTSTLPAKAVVISFDDGLNDQYENAVPILKQFGYPAIFFVNYGRINWWWGYFSWAKLKNLLANGMEIGSHGLTHKDLAKLSPGRALNELKPGKIKLEQQLGAPVKFLSYANGQYNDTVIKLAKDAGFWSAVTDRGGAIHNRADGAFAVSRLSAPDNLEEFIKLFQ